MMMQQKVFRIVQINDPHLDSVAPVRRIDDYFVTMCLKLKEVQDWVLSNSVDAVVFTGDLFNKNEGARVPYKLTVFYLQYLKGFGDIPVFGIPGNHDLLMNAKLDNQPIRVLYEAGVLIYPGASYMVDHGGYKVNFSGESFYYDIDKDRKGYMMSRDSECVNVKIAHGMLLHDGMSYFESWTNPSDLKDFEGDLILCGHYHENLGVFDGIGKHGKFQCVNYGSLGRGSVSGYKDDRIPGFAVIDLMDDGAADFTFYGLGCAQPYKDVFAVEKYLDEKEQENKMREVVESLSELGVFEHKNADQVFAESVLILSEELRDRAREYLRRAKEIV